MEKTPLGNLGQPQQAAPVWSTVLHMCLRLPGQHRSLPALANAPAHGLRVLTGCFMAVTIPAAAWHPLSQPGVTPRGLLSLAGDMHPLHKPQRDPSDLKGGSTSIPYMRLYFSPSQTGLALQMQLTLFLFTKDLSQCPLPPQCRVTTTQLGAGLCPRPQESWSQCCICCEPRIGEG